jgi:lipoprotein-anchoring transpeptidase ErfK/SrfK
MEQADRSIFAGDEVSAAGGPVGGRVSRRRALGVVGLAAAGVASLAACGDDAPTWSDPTKDKPVSKAKVVIAEPAADATDVPASVEIVYTVENAAQTKVSLKNAAGAEVAGAMHPDGAGWLPDKALDYGAAYTAEVTATDGDGVATTATAKFTTMTQPANVVSIVSFLADGAVVGVGMPLIFRLSRAVPKEHRAALQRRLLVRTDPVQEGIWTWYAADEMHWRPREFWTPQSKIFVDVRAGGLPLGDNFYAKRNSTLTCGIGRSLVMTIDDAASPKVMNVALDGASIRAIRVSLGRPTMPSSSGTTVIIERLAKTVFDTRTDPNPANRYRTDIEYAQRLTWGGEFIHAAPWSVGDQGVRNVSHGCVNMSLPDAKWLFEQTMMGDPVITKNTPRQLQQGNGWTDFNLPWEEYVKLSAIPYVPPAAPPSAAPSASSTG